MLEDFWKQEMLKPNVKETLKLKQMFYCVFSVNNYSDLISG